MAQAEKIASEKRKRISRVVNEDGISGDKYGVLKVNNYGDEGEPSIFDREKLYSKTSKSKRKPRPKAGVDFQNDDYCGHCWDGGDLVLCDFCPAAFHLECMGLSKKYILPPHSLLPSPPPHLPELTPHPPP